MAIANQAVTDLHEVLDRARIAQRTQKDREYTSELRIMSLRDGDIKLRWKKGDKNEIALAKEAFTKAINRGFRAFRIDARGQREGQAIGAFDPTAERIVLVPQIVGG